MKRIIIVCVRVVVLALSIAVLLVFDIGRKSDAVASIQSFEDCRKAGYPVMESYPAQCKTPDGRTFTEVVTMIEEKIRVTLPQPYAHVASPLSVYGFADASLFFEGTFPIFIRDAAGEEIVHGTAHAEKEIAGPGFVAFRGTINFPDTLSGTGVVVFEKDNPSDLPENAFAFELPVQFGTSSSAE